MISKLDNDELIKILSRPIVLASDNFVDPSLTPWGGNYIRSELKKGILTSKKSDVVGESWEFSVWDNERPSRTKDGRYTLRQLFKNTALVYGEELAFKLQARNGLNDLLIKIIDTKQKLSFQVHPDEGCADLARHECGKSEAWLVLRAAPGAGVYLGFRPGVSDEEFKANAQAGKSIDPFVQFIELEKYDYVRVPPGTPHAIGEGLTVIEPQLIMQGKEGKTFRISDWGRSYTPDGEGSVETGRQRELHIEPALKLVSTGKQAGAEYTQRLISKAIVKNEIPGVTELFYEEPLTSHLQVFLAEKDAVLGAAIGQGYLVICVLEGELLLNKEGPLLSRGETCFVSNAAGKLHLTATVSSEFVAMSPLGSVVVWN